MLYTYADEWQTVKYQVSEYELQSSVIHIYSLLNQRVDMFQKFIAKSVQVLVTWILERWQHCTMTSWCCMRAGVIQSCHFSRGHFSHIWCRKPHNCRIWGRASLQQPHGQWVVQHHAGPNCWALLLPREHHHQYSLPGYARNLCVPTDISWS
jgi:hypothetical protein